MAQKNSTKHIFFIKKKMVHLANNGVTAWLIYLHLAIGFLLSFTTYASTLPNGFSETRIATGLDPTGMEFAPDGRLFVTEKAGRVRIIKNGNLLPTPFLTLSVNNNDERGLQTLIFDPNFASNQYVYVYYTVASSPVHNRVSRFRANGDLVVPGSETILLELDNLQASIHNGGGMFFSGGKLFITAGDNGMAQNAQSLTTLLGKVLRINPDGSIPTDNPFYNTTTGKNRAIWAFGFRHPYRATVQPGTERIFVSEVGGAYFEEIDEVFAGKNYGYPSIEGYRTNETPPANYQDPAFAYAHTDGCAITGGAFYNQVTNHFPANYAGKYFFADYCKGYIRTLDVTNGDRVIADFAANVNRPVALKVGPDGSLYYLARGGLGGGSVEDNTASSEGEVWRVQYTGSNVPTISAQPLNQVAPVGGTATFTVGASGTGLSYQWQRNGANIAGATGTSYTRSPVVQDDDGVVFRVVVTNSSGTVNSNGATLTITSNQNPVGNILSPTPNGRLYSGGEVITFSGSATDQEDGNLSPEAFEWQIDFHHDTHFHPGPTPDVAGDGKSGSFTVPRLGETSTNVWYRIHLTVTDLQGSKSSTYVDVRPKVVTLTMATNPAGLQVSVNGQQPRLTPYDNSFVAGTVVNLTVPSPQVHDGTTYTFANWTPNVDGNGNFNMPDGNATYTANFTASGGPAVTLRDPENPANAVAGLDYQYYEGEWDFIPDFNALTPVKVGTARNVDVYASNRNEQYAMRFMGYVYVPTNGQYTFYTASDDGSKLFIGTTEIVNNDGRHGPIEKSGNIGLKAGMHAMTVTFLQAGGGRELTVSYEGPGLSKRMVPFTSVYRVPGGTPPPPPPPPPPTPTTLRDPENPANAVGGLDYQYYEGEWATLPDFNALTPAKTGTSGNVDVTVSTRNEQFALRFRGYVNVPTDGQYTFYTASDDGSKLLIGTTEVVNNDGLHGLTEQSGSIGLKAGRHALTVQFLQGGGGREITVSYAGPGLGKQTIPASAYYRVAGGTPPPPPPPPPVTLRDPENPANAVGGLDYQYYEGEWATLPDFNALTPAKTGTAGNVDVTVSIRNEQFALRFRGYVNVPTDGQYTFYTASDDGSKLLIGTTEVVNNDGLHGLTEQSGSIGLKAGRHALTVQFLQGGGGREITVSYAGPGLGKQTIPASAYYRVAGGTPPPPPPPPPVTLRDPENPANAVGGLDYQYYEGEWATLPDFNALTPAKTGTSGNVDVTVSTRNEQFALRFRGYVNVPTDGQYTFYTASDDGSKLLIGTTEVVNNDGLHGLTEQSGSIGLKAGRHALTVQFLQGGGGREITVSYAGPGLGKQTIPASAYYRVAGGTTPPPPPPPTPAPSGGTGTGLLGEYFNNQTLTVPAVLTRVDPIINFYWGNGAPASSVNADNFSVRWTGQVEAPVSGNYVFSTVSDDGVRLWVNGVQVINNWTDHGNATDTSVPIALTAGQKYDIRMEYYENNGGAVAQLMWAYPGVGTQTIPQTRLYPPTNGNGNRLAALDAVDDQSEQTVRVFPVPARDEVRIGYRAGSAGELTLQLVNAIAQPVRQVEYRVVEGENLIRMPVQDLNRGLYILIMTQGNQRITRKVLLAE
ncbi:PA14 domain-containing protein [Spirosoma arcticum]